MGSFRQYLVLVSASLLIVFAAYPAFAQKDYTIAAIQGDKNTSPVEKENVRTTGVVTAILKSGFFIQTPDKDVDQNPNTSKGIYVYGANSTAIVSIGDLISVTGIVSEYVKRGESPYFPTTEITKPEVKIISKNNSLPAPITLTAADLDPKGKLYQMEKYEGMRVRADIVIVGPTGGYTNEKTGVVTSNGLFFATLQGTPRPFREPGVAAITALADKLPNTVPVFDMNPEILQVNSGEQIGAKMLDLPDGATIRGLTGVIQYERSTYTLIVDAANLPTPENIKGFVPVSPAGDREVTIGSFNVENFFDDEVNSSDVDKEATLPKEMFQNRLNKVSLAIRNVLSMPDVLGIVEMENLKVLQKVADKINADAVASGKPDPKYVPYLEEGNDVRGIDVGFLVKSTKVRVTEVKQLAKSEKLNYGPAFPDEKLFDRTPLMLRAEVADTKTGKPFAFTVIVNHLKSYRGVDDEKDGDRIRNKRRLEAEWLANFIQERAKADPNERMLVCGDFNAFQFNDGYNDLIGILRGKPDPNVLVPSKTIYTTGLVDLINSVPNVLNRYSYTYDGSAQVLDHILVNKPVYLGRSIKFGYARVDADFPLVWSNDATRPERISDHDAPVVFLSLDDAATPVSGSTPAAVQTSSPL